ncbi:MAG TPA: MobF family relaxase, partial [Acidimicrobiales bacterium]|nr:MobF family relaxase [Acidimicrobiales bacterium]
MRIAKLGAGSEAYYLHNVAAGAEDHRRGGMEPDGAWLGRGAASLGLQGPVAAAPLTAVLGGSHPGTGAPLRPARSRVRVVGFDLTVAAPKSVSVLEGLGDPVLGATVRAAHEAAVAGALGYVDREASWARRHQGGRVRQVPVRGLVVAAFVHRTSRASDPHLHSHVLVANLGEADDDTWSALDARGLYAHARTAGYLYQAGLRHELGQRLGARFGPVVNGVAQLAGVDPRVTSHLSRRRAEVEKRLAAWGTATPAAAQAAALATRGAKPPARPEAELRAGWRDQVRALGADPEVLRPPASPVPGPVPGTDEVASVVVGRGGPLAARATFGRRELVRAVAAALPAGAPPTAVEG